MIIFLTGDFGAGKTTLASTLSAEWPCEVWGFRTYKQTEANGDVGVWLADVRLPHTPHRFAFFPLGGEKQFSPEVFNTAGVELLKNMKPNPDDLIVLDEIGYIESNAIAFQHEIRRVLGLGVPVLAVLRKDKTPFLNELFRWPGAAQVEVEARNRNKATAYCRELLGLLKK